MALISWWSISISGEDIQILHEIAKKNAYPWDTVDGIHTKESRKRYNNHGTLAMRMRYSSSSHITIHSNINRERRLQLFFHAYTALYSDVFAPMGAIYLKF